MFDPMMFPDCTNMLYRAAETARVRTALLLFAFQATKMAWQYGYERSTVKIAYRDQVASAGRVTRPIRQGRIQMLEVDETMARSLKRLETQVMRIRLHAKRTCDGMTSRLALKTEKPSRRSMKDK